MRYFIQLSLLAITALLLAGCSTTRHSSFETAVIDPNGNVHLYISNQSFAISPVDIKVFIDGRRVVNESFEVGSQHTIVDFVLSLTPGRHKIVATSSKGDAKFQQDFEVSDKAWVDLAYWYDPEITEGARPCPRHFSFHVSKEPIFFY